MNVTRYFLNLKPCMQQDKVREDITLSLLLDLGMTIKVRF